MSKNALSLRFVENVVTEWKGLFGESLENDYKKKLCQHLFLKIDSSFKELNQKWKSKGVNKEINWENINSRQLLVDAVHRINLGLDGLLKNHIHVTPFLNTATGKYDVQLFVGYQGKDFYMREMAKHEIVDIRYELVYENDYFLPLKKDLDNDIENYVFQIKEPFNRGKIIGGFGYIQYEIPAKNNLIILDERAFKRAKEASKQQYFWQNNPNEMMYKTIVHRTTDRIQLDPMKINESFSVVENDYNDEPENVSETEPAVQEAKVEIETEHNITDSPGF